MNTPLAVVGAGLVGTQHVHAINQAPGVALAAIVDPSPVGKQLATRFGVAYLESLSDLLNQELAEGVIIATPNQLHVEQALACISHGIPVLVEKPLAADLAGALIITQAAENANVPVLTGHHRRHNPLIVKARQTISDGELGEISLVQSNTWFYKPDDYFSVDWRCQPGAGPVFINLVHDIDILRHLCGEIQQVYAMESNLMRHHDVEDTAVISLRFTNGALGTMSVSDTVVAPWSWELTARENPAYPPTGEACYQIGGSRASLALPNLALWRYPQERGWWEPISVVRSPHALDNPLVCQVLQFSAVIQGREVPLVSARDGMENLRVIEAIKTSVTSGKPVSISSGPSV